MEKLARKILMGLLAVAAVVTFSAGCENDDTTADNDRSHHSEHEDDD